MLLPEAGPEDANLTAMVSLGIADWMLERVHKYESCKKIVGDTGRGWETPI